MEPKATPPDDGGERGAFTRPEDTLEQPTDARPDPRIVREVEPGNTKRGSFALWLILTAVLLLVVLFAYCLAPAANMREPQMAPAGPRE